MRLFVAVDLGDAITGAVDRAAARLVELAPAAKWLAAPAMHVTLVFLGEIGEDRAPPISEAIRGVAARHASFELSVEGGGTFGQPLRPRVLWLGLGGEVAALAALQAELARCLRPLGYEPEHRAFSPHLTLARARGHAGDPALDRCASALKELRLGPARVGELVLYRSELTPGGSIYTPILRAPLAS